MISNDVKNILCMTVGDEYTLMGNVIAIKNNENKHIYLFNNDGEPVGRGEYLAVTYYLSGHGLLIACIREINKVKTGSRLEERYDFNTYQRYRESVDLVVSEAVVEYYNADLELVTVNSSRMSLTLESYSFMLNSSIGKYIDRDVPAKLTELSDGGYNFKTISASARYLPYQTLDDKVLANYFKRH